MAVNIGKLYVLALPPPFFLDKLCSTGLPSELDGYDSLSDTDDEYLDEADEDSNGEHISSVFQLC